ncbi:non-ribosomal peptide synthetase [Nocardia seriolae]|uniref:non-ribosomal peptide synthetase n=1 Tax=Nocardia seriolae TaxID=37332 RepID=UPI000D126506|nr:non-ribosomal peptide synthetase [Nocardia seriolae]PSK31973.1 non-ribosomal peptide synthetase [Nocardia seriolae]QUN17297.1 amino acid adenylation domain-containing protein [Nocardia seriolae]
MSSLATDRVDQCSSGEFSAQPFALSPAQSALWYAQRIRPDIPLTIAQFVEIHGDLDVGRLLYAIERFGAESEVGHVRLLEIDGVPHQVVDPSWRPGWARIDLREEPDPRAAARAWMNEHASSPIDIERDPLTMNVVLRVGDSDWIWYTRGHHIVIDGYGAMNATTRAAEIYTALENQTEPVVSRAAPLAAIYGDENRYRDTSRFVTDSDYWREQLTGVGEPITLSGNGSLPVVSDGGRRTATAVIGRDVETAIEAAATAFGTNSSALFVAALAGYARAVTGTQDVVLSLPVSARTTVALRRSGGVVSNVVPIRVQFSATDTVADTVRAIELQITGALRHQRYRSDDIRRDCGYSRDARGFFGPMVNLMLFHSELKFGSLMGSINVLSTGPVEDLSINLYNGLGNRIHIDFEANPRLYGDAELSMHHGRFLDYLSRFVGAAPQTVIADMPVLTDLERERVLHEWNSTQVARQEGTLAGLFADRAAMSAGRIALDYEGETLTYAAFDERANRLARELVSRGVGPDTLIGLAVRRSLDLLIGMYAIVKAGAAYLPIDPDHPADRIEAILEQARPLCVLTTVRDRLELPLTAPRFDIDTADLSRHSGRPVTDADRRAPLRADHLAYVIFTSGSTGKPKGVGVTHAAIVNRLRWMQHAYPLDGSDVVLQKTPATFDVSVWEFFWPLQIGARLVIAAPDGHRDPGYLARVIAEQGVTTAHFVPSMLSVFLTDTDVAGCTGLTRVFCSGEALPAATVAEFHAALGAGPEAPQLHNLYGPTEAAVDVTSWHCVPGTTEVPIGAPIWNTRTYVLDARLQPVAPGVVGELYLAGVQLARGYLGRAALTADRFVANPFTPGTRMYRTGDLVRWRGSGRSGVLEYLGRSDFQVKVRGLRIELGEIEAALLAEERVARAVCVARRGRGGDELIAYVVGAPGAESFGPAQPLDTAELTAALRRTLPSYMVPSFLMVLDELPLSANGKVDRKALPEPDAGARRPARPAAAPSNAVERQLTGIFAEVLGTDEFDVEDSFFDLGGNSLTAARAVARVNAALGAALTIRDLFETSTVTALATRLSDSRPEHASPKLVAGPRPQHIPLSLAQQRLWILNRFAEHAAAYNMPLAVKLTGPLDIPALRAGLVDVLERHESLRTTFPDTPDGPCQLVHPAAEIPLTLDPIDATHADVHALASEFAGYSFDLRSQAPVRVALYATGPDAYVFLMVLHHISGDGWSIAPLIRDIMTAVAARAGGHAPAWTPMPVQYADFALWQRELLGDEADPASALARQLAYWRAALADLPDQLDLPLDRPRPRQRSTDGGTVAFTIPSDTRRALAAVAAERGVSTFMVLHAALATVLARLCNTTDIAIGTPIAGRSDPALDDLVGMCVNTLVLRTRVDPAAGFDRMLTEVRDTDLNAFANADVPFERLVEVVNPERSAARHPLFQVMLSYDGSPELRVDLPGVDTEVLPMADDVAKFDLQLTVHEPAGGPADGAPLTAEFGYAADVFDRATVEAIARRFGVVLAAAVADPSLPVGDLPLLDARETAKLVPIMGSPAEPAISLARLLTDTAERVPDAVAVRYLGADTTYRELDERSNRLARVLIEHGAGPEVVVAIALPRGHDSILAVWSVAKTGAAYVPIDPDYPSDRIAHMLADSGAMLGITDAERRAELPDWPGSRGRHRKSYVDWLLLGSDQLAEECAQFPDTAVTDADRHHPLRTGGPAYLIYTSGSTGRPKAVVVTNAGLSSLAHEQMHLFKVTDSARTLHFSSPSFDASVLELLLGFAAGATIVVVPAGIFGGIELARILREEKVTHAFVTPAALGTVPADDLPDLEAVIVGGEACPEELVTVWTAPESRPGLPARRMHNMYGPSEATVAATATGPMVAGQPVPIGGPVRGMRLFVLDGRLHPVPPGVAGELYLSGPGLARGYLGRHDLTAQRFPANPHGRRGERMYRTGDLVVADGTGQLRFLGRADDQIKIRGFRIELREIDHVLAAHPGVTFALTVVHHDERGIPRLVAYLTADTELEPAAVLEAARGRLPGYMVPSALSILDAMPVTPSGKLDRKALPAPEFVAAAPTRAPETELEQQVALVFGAVLGATVPGADDNFFEIGGNSLLATRLTASLHTEFGVELPVRAIFEAPTVAGLAARLAEAPRTQRIALAVHSPRPERVPLSLPQQRLWFLNRYSPESSAYNIAFVLRIDGDPDIDALRAALADVVERHEVLRTVFPEDEHGAYQVVLDTARCLPVLEPVETDDVGARTALRSLARRGFDLTREIPLRMTLLRTGNRRHLLGIALHHIAADGWSLAPLTRDLAIAYTARHGDAAPTWAPLPVQYADFSLWQRDLLGADTDADSAAAAQLAYWRHALADLPEELPLPYDRTRPAEPTGRAGTVRFEVPEALQRKLADVARAHGVSLFMVLRSTLAVLLRAVTGGRDVVIGTPVAGRTDTRLDDLVGMFVNTLILRSDVDPDRSFAELLQADRDTELAAMAHAEVPYERVVEELQTADGEERQRRYGARPLLQVALTVQDTPVPALRLPGLSLHAEELDIALAKFDLELRVLPGPDNGDDRVFEFVYAAELFDQTTVDTLAERMLRVFAAVAADPRVRVRDIDARTELEREMFTPAWGPAPEPQCSLAAYCAATAHLNADRVFLRFDDTELTYLESDVYSNRLARALIHRGLGPGDRVALGLTRSVESVLAVLAVAKCGAAFVPVDPNYPADRVRHMLVDSGCRVGISMTEHSADLHTAAGDHPVDWLLLDNAELLDELEVLDDGPLTDAERATTLWTADLAYVIYTSGSTGKPKGVAVTHGGLSNFADEIRERMRVDRDSRTMHFSSPSFDAAIFDLLLAVGAGATMIIVPPDVYGGDELAALMDREEVSHTFMTPAALATIDRERWALPHLRSVMVGGEACGPELVARWAPGRMMFNGYGPTETTVVVTIAGPLAVGAPITIGTLVRGARALVLDERLRPVPVGVPGELYIGGQGCARGYFERLDLTASRFVADPYGPEGSRLYRTGDVVRWTTGGEIAYLGRSDHQVKVRGFRIELGEIDGVLTAHRAIRFAHTEVREIAGARRIVSYVLPLDPAAAPDLEELRAHCATELPAHMVPSAITLLDRIPLTPVGKLDRDALPQPQAVVAVVSRDPETDTERLVAEVMGELVGAEALGADDSFFEVGGNSLLATQLVARLATATGVRLEVRTVFAAPTVAGLAAALDAGSASADLRPEPRKRTRPARIPLSAAQRRLWFLEQFNASGDHGEALGAYNVPVALRLHGELDIPALRAALHEVQRRHETLRTVFPEIDGEPCQQILEPGEAAVTLPLRTVPESAVPEEIRRVTASGFDLATCVPLRAALLRITGSKTEHVLVLVVHHIAMDGWSLQPLAADVAAAYRAHSGKAGRDGGAAGRDGKASGRDGKAPGRDGKAQSPEWPELPIQYADYTLWQQDVLGREDDPESVISRQLDYWRRALDGIPELLAVPADRPRPPVPSYRGGTVECTLDPFTHRELQNLAAEHGVTMFMVLHAALVALLHRLTSGDDITVGTPIAGRGHPALDRMVGMFVGTLVLRTHLDGGAAFADLLRAVRDTDLEAFAHADVPFERLVEVLNPVRSQAHHPMFQVMLSVQNQPVRVLELPGMRIEADDADPGIAKFDLQFTLTESWTGKREPDGITVSVNYAADLFDEATAARLAQRFVRLLGAAAANPATAVGDLELLDSGEWSALAPVRGTEPGLPITFPEVFEAAANLNRSAIAVRSAGTQISYDALDRWTNRLARVLIGYGVGPETLVAMGIPRSAESVAVMLAIAKAGAAFVPVDPNYPEQRISHMLLDSGAAVGITLSSYRERMPDGANWTVLDAPSFRRRVLATSDAPISDTERTTSLRMDNPAYVIYTSGSTGIPKGVVVTHGGLSNFAAETAHRFDVGPGCRVLHFATPSFDAAMLDLLLALGGAATLVITPPGVVGGQELGQVFIEEGITHAFITTSALGTVDPTGVTALRHVLVGGEALPPDLVTRWAPGRKLYNVYGPTETTIVTVISQPMTPGGQITIGGPIRGVGATVLDARLQPAPGGVTGELHLAGAALARGYLRRPGMTAQRFVANPFGKPGERMYRTGYLVRWLERGGRARDLEYVGRTDHQVKIRGFRIELGEIDAALAKHPAVEFATTIGHRTPAGSTALVSYVKPRNGSAPTTAELTAHVADLVPNYMVPQSIMLLDRVPLSPVGKLDRKALPEPVFAAREGYRAPETPIEEALCAAFAEVLGIEQVGADDGFFELGGNSLLATKVVAQLRAAGVDLPVQAMFGDSTPAAIAARLAAADGDAGAALAAALGAVLPLRPVTADSSVPPLFCVHPAIGLSWCFAGLLSHLPHERPVYGLQAPHVAGEESHRTIAEAAKYYVAHMKSVQPHGPYHVLGWSLGGLLAHEVAVQLQQGGDEVALLALMDSYQLSDRWLEAAVPSVSAIIAEFGSDLLGGDADIDPRMTLHEAAELLRSRSGPFAALTVEHLERLYTGYENGAQQAHGFQPHVFDGDLLFFTAADDEINRADPDRCAAAWEPYVTGVVHDQLVRCTHAGMTTPESLAVIGPVLRDRLAAIDARREGTA